jgi:divalent metal cation (Fe/Co/Zn/Cd) transporter
MIRSRKDVMSADLRDAFAEKAVVTGVSVQAGGWPWVETALAAFLVAAAVLFVSFLSVATNL